MNSSYTVCDGRNGQVSTSTQRCNKSSNKTVQRVFIRENEREVEQDGLIKFIRTGNYYTANFNESVFKDLFTKQNSQAQVRIYKNLFKVDIPDDIQLTTAKYKLIGHAIQAFWENSIISSTDKQSTALLRYAIEQTPSIYGSVMAIWMCHFMHEYQRFQQKEPFVPLCFTSTLYINEKSVECNMLVKIMWCFLKIVFNDVEPKMNDTKLKAIADNIIRGDGMGTIELFEHMDFEHQQIISCLFYRLVVADKETAILKEICNYQQSQMFELEPFMDIPPIIFNQNEKEERTINSTFDNEGFHGLPTKSQTITQNVIRPDFAEVTSFVYNLQYTSWHYVQVTRESVYGFKIQRKDKNGNIETNDIVHQFRQTITQDVYKLLPKDYELTVSEFEQNGIAMTSNEEIATIIDRYISSNKYSIYDIKLISTSVKVTPDRNYTTDKAQYDQLLEQYNQMVADKTDSFKGGYYEPTQDEIDRGYKAQFKDVKNPISPQMVQKFVDFTCGEPPKRDIPAEKYFQKFAENDNAFLWKALHEAIYKCVISGNSIERFNNTLFAKIFFGVDDISNLNICPFEFSKNGILCVKRNINLRLLYSRREVSDSIKATYNALYEMNDKTLGPDMNDVNKEITTFSNSSIKIDWNLKYNYSGNCNIYRQVPRYYAERATPYDMKCNREFMELLQMEHVYQTFEQIYQNSKKSQDAKMMMKIAMKQRDLMNDLPLQDEEFANDLFVQVTSAYEEHKPATEQIRGKKAIDIAVKYIDDNTVSRDVMVKRVKEILIKARSLTCARLVNVKHEIDDYFAKTYEMYQMQIQQVMKFLQTELTYLGTDIKYINYIQPLTAKLQENKEIYNSIFPSNVIDKKTISNISFMDDIKIDIYFDYFTFKEQVIRTAIQTHVTNLIKAEQYDVSAVKEAERILQQQLSEKRKAEAERRRQQQLKQQQILLHDRQMYQSVSMGIATGDYEEYNNLSEEDKRKFHIMQKADEKRFYKEIPTQEMIVITFTKKSK